MEQYRTILLVAVLMLPLLITFEGKFVNAMKLFNTNGKKRMEEKKKHQDCYDTVTACHMAKEAFEIKDDETGMTFNEYELEQL